MLPLVVLLSASKFYTQEWCHQCVNKQEIVHPTIILPVSIHNMADTILDPLCFACFFDSLSLCKTPYYYSIIKVQCMTLCRAL